MAAAARAWVSSARMASRICFTGEKVPARYQRVGGGLGKTAPVGALTDHLQNLSQGWLYLIVGLLVFAEYAGLLLPGETAAILAGALASSGHAHVSVVLVIVVVPAITGDCVGYEIGRRFGPRLLRLRILARYERRIGQAMDFLDRRGGTAVFLARFLSFFRSAMPILAGMSRMPYRKFMTF